MDNVKVPSHDTYLKMLDCLIAAIVGEKKPSWVTVRDPNKAMPKQHMVTITRSPVSGKDLTMIQMDVCFATTCAPRSKGNRLECALACWGHEIKSVSRHVLSHQLQGCIVVIRMAKNVAKALGQKVCMEDSWFSVIEMKKARIAKNAMA